MTSYTKVLLVIAAIYLGALGLALLIVPAQFGVGAVPEDPSSELIALLRLLGGPFLGIAVLNVMACRADAAVVRRTVVLANLVGFGVVAVNDIIGVAGGTARDLAQIFVVVHVAFAIAFVVAVARQPVARTA
ncbi:hypothetical protein GJV80_00990 [Microlunatus sp. Gsoil 973]|nr:hypothetical protein GJV80_00990 [Microlunatus sp. Gsoil 973]